MRMTTEYMKSDAHRANLALHCPEGMKRNTLRVLLCYVPGPLGLGLSQKRTAEFLGIAPKTVWRILNELKKKYPPAWARIQMIRRVMERQRRGLLHIISLDRLINSMGEEGVQNIISHNNVLEEIDGKED